MTSTRKAKRYVSGTASISRGGYNIRKKSPRKKKSSLPSLEDFLDQRDYVGASTLLDFQPLCHQQAQEQSKVKTATQTLLWKAYCAFHNDDTEKAQDIYIDLLSREDISESNGDNGIPKETVLYLACAYIRNKMYKEAREIVDEGPECSLKNRILYMLTYELGRDDYCDDDDAIETKLKEYQKKLNDGNTDNQLLFAYVSFSNGNYQDAIDIYKRLLSENRESIALNVYVALCYFKMDYYDVSNEVLDTYEQAHNECISVANLRACNKYHLYNGAAALDVYNEALDHQDTILHQNIILCHNSVVFSEGERSLQYLPPLVGNIREARLNLAIYHLKNGSFEEAEGLLDELLEPSTSQECILMGVVKTIIGQMEENPKLIREAQSYFDMVGSSSTETDTIPGRQCMASSLFLKRDYSEANVYLSSIKSYMSDDDDFNWTFGMSLASTGNYASAEDILLKVQENAYRCDPYYLSWLAVCYVHRGKASEAWNLRSSVPTENDEYFLKILANECFREKDFLVAEKAFHTLCSINDRCVDYRVGLKSSCLGVFRTAVLAKIQSSAGISKKIKANLVETIKILKFHKDDKVFKDIGERIICWMRQNE